jgi:hypothetical protein
MRSWPVERHLVVEAVEVVRDLEIGLPARERSSDLGSRCVVERVLPTVWEGVVQLANEQVAKDVWNRVSANRFFDKQRLDLRGRNVIRSKLVSQHDERDAGAITRVPCNSLEPALPYSFQNAAMPVARPCFPVRHD